LDSRINQVELEKLAEDGIYEEVASKPCLLSDLPTHYCPGCDHDTIHRILAELIEEFSIATDTTFVWPVGCSAFGAWYLAHKIDLGRDDARDVDLIDAAHGRAPAVATGIKRAQPDRVVISYHGDGDFAVIGTAETVHLFNRGENVTVIFVNNAIYRMTGGQMAPTTLPNQQSTLRTYRSGHGQSDKNVRDAVDTRWHPVGRTCGYIRSQEHLEGQVVAQACSPDPTGQQLDRGTRHLPG